MIININNSEYNIAFYTENGNTIVLCTNIEEGNKLKNTLDVGTNYSLKTEENEYDVKYMADSQIYTDDMLTEYNFFFETSENQTTEEKVDTLSNSVSDEWESERIYRVDEYCMNNDTLWKCKIQHNGVEPEEGVYWTKVNMASELNYLASLIK